MPRLRRPRSPAHLVRLLGAALLATAALVLAVRAENPPASARGPASVAVPVAAGDLAPGTVLEADDLADVRLAPDVVPAGAARDPTALVGRVLAGAVRDGEPITDVRLVGPALTDVLPPGRVGAPVRLADLAVTELVEPGSRVDVLASPPDGSPAEVVAGDALVLARPESQDDGAGGLLLLAVDPGTAAELAAAATTATLTVSLAAS